MQGHIKHADARLALAERIMTVLREQPEVGEALLRGSLAEGTADKYSDIDIGVDTSGHDNAAFARKLVDLMYASFDIHLHDLAGSLLPHRYVITFFIKGVPLFWNVDVEVAATPHSADLTRHDIPRQGVAGFLKVWVLNAKYLLRNTDGIDEQIASYAQRVLGNRSAAGLSSALVLKRVLDELNANSGGQYSEFITECYGIYERDLA